MKRRAAPDPQERPRRAGARTAPKERGKPHRGAASTPAGLRRQRESQPGESGDAPVRFVEATRSRLRATLLDAAGVLLASRGWSEISMADIAARAGVSRQTLYNEFGSREEFAQALALRTANAFLSQVNGTLASHAKDPERGLREAYEQFLSEARTNPLVRAIVLRTSGAEELLSLFTTRGQAVMKLATDHLTQLVQAHWPIRKQADARPLSELIVRIAVSHASLPTAPPKRASSELATLLSPYLREVLLER